MRLGPVAIFAVGIPAGVVGYFQEGSHGAFIGWSAVVIVALAYWVGDLQKEIDVLRSRFNGLADREP